MKEQIQQEQVKSQEQIGKELITEIVSFPELISKFHLEIAEMIHEGPLDEKLFKLIEEKSIIFVDKQRFKLLEKIGSNLGTDSNMYEIVDIGTSDLIALSTMAYDIRENPLSNEFNKILNKTKEKFEMINLAIKVGENPCSKVSDDQE